MRVMIAEDEKRASRGLKRLLESISDECEVIAEAADGKKAFELIKVLRPEVVFTDIRMPYMDGIALIKAVRSQMLEVKFVIISAYEEFELARKAISLGVLDYLVKPLTLEDVEMVWKKIIKEEPQSVSGAEFSEGLKRQYPDAHPLVLKALEILESSYATRISQRDLSEMLGISAEYFSFLFNRDVGENFSKFLRKYRIEKARMLIDTKAVSKEQIPFSVGFSDIKYFGKCFKEETGVSVTSYIKGER